MTATYVFELAYALNVLANTLDGAGHPKYSEAKAANVWAGTTGKELEGALNAKNGTTGIGFDTVCNQLASTVNVDGTNKWSGARALSILAGGQ